MAEDKLKIAGISLEPEELKIYLIPVLSSFEIYIFDEDNSIPDKFLIIIFFSNEIFFVFF